MPEPEMVTVSHFCISVRGMLLWSTREAKKNMRSIRKDDGTPFRNVAEFREAMMDELAKGREVLPMSRDCEGFDYKKGCPGHRQPKVTEARP